MRQYEMLELSVRGAPPEGSEALSAVSAVFRRGGEETRVDGFYAGNGVYKVRFLPEKTGAYRYEITGDALAAPQRGAFTVDAAERGKHGPVRAEGIHLRHADGTWYHGFGTTVYALAHQSEALIAETMETLAASPFNKLRTCVFPKHYTYNENNPAYYPFERRAGLPERAFPASETPPVPQKRETRDDYWDVNRPCYAFWDALDRRLKQLEKLGIETDLILFHPYDRWGFSNLSQEDSLVYLSYLLRRIAAYPHVWWSLANEYDLCLNKTDDDWRTFARFIAAHDPYRHLLSNHNCFKLWDPAEKEITHVSWQTRELSRVAEAQRRWNKPVLVDECRYEGNVPEFWGNVSGADMTSRFWKVTVQGGYCTHGETFLPGTAQGGRATATGEADVVWWAKGGKLNGESPERIRFLREIVESLPGPLEPLGGGLGDVIGMSDGEVQDMIDHAPPGFNHFLARMARMNEAERDRFFGIEYQYRGHVGEDAYLYYLDDQCAAAVQVELPANRYYRVEVLDTWAMTRETVAEHASGTVRAALPGRPYMAVLAVAEPHSKSV